MRSFVCGIRERSPLLPITTHRQCLSALSDNYWYAAPCGFPIKERFKYHSIWPRLTGRTAESSRVSHTKVHSLRTCITLPSSSAQLATFSLQKECSLLKKSINRRFQYSLQTLFSCWSSSFQLPQRFRVLGKECRYMYHDGLVSFWIFKPFLTIALFWLLFCQNLVDQCCRVHLHLIKKLWAVRFEGLEAVCCLPRYIWCTCLVSTLVPKNSLVK